MQRSFEHFMLTGNVLTTPVKNRSLPPTPNNKKISSSTKKKPAFQKLAQHVQTAVDAFHKIFVNEWLSHDDQMCLVVNSVADLRERIWIASRRTQFVSNTAVTIKQPPVDWKHYGSRGPSPAEFLLDQDLELALSHSLKAHERMLVALRQGLSQLSQAQDTLRRRLDDVLAHFSSYQVQEVVAPCDEEAFGRLYQSVGEQVEDCLELHRSSAAELYRKQVLGQDLMDSDSDWLLFSDEGRASTSQQDSFLPKKFATTVSAKWSRSHKESCLVSRKEKIEEISKQVKDF